MPEERPAMLVPSYPKNPTFADSTRKTIIEAIKDFESKLKPDQEVGGKLAQFGQTIEIAIEHVGFRQPYLIEITGRTPQGDRCVLVQHMNQTNILLIALPVPGGRTPRRMGFN